MKRSLGIWVAAIVAVFASFLSGGCAMLWTLDQEIHGTVKDSSHALEGVVVTAGEVSRVTNQYGQYTLIGQFTHDREIIITFSLNGYCPNRVTRQVTREGKSMWGTSTSKTALEVGITTMTPQPTSGTCP